MPFDVTRKRIADGVISKETDQCLTIDTGNKLSKDAPRRHATSLILKHQMPEISSPARLADRVNHL